MGLWFFLSVVVAGNFLYKAFKLRMLARPKVSDDRIAAVERELKSIREKVQSLDEAVFFGDFELKRQFSKLENEMAAKDKRI